MKRAFFILFIAALLLGTSLAGRAPALSATSIEPMRPTHIKLPVRDLKTLSKQDRLTLPVDTKVMLGKRIVTLGELRRIHAALVASRLRVKSLKLSNLTLLTGQNHSVRRVYTINRTLGGITLHPSPSPSPGHVAIVPLKMKNPYHLPSPQPATLPFVAAGNVSTYPLDYQQFCKSVTATLCLFYPAGVAWYGQQGNSFWTIDYLVTDPNVCAQEGGFIGYQSGWGQLNGDGCIYEYPASQTVQFVPPSAGFKTSGWCNPSMFSTVVDSPHGVVQVKDAGAHTQPVEEFCFLKVTLNH